MIQIALFATAVFCVLLGTVVFLNNPRALLFRVYFTFSLISALWMVVNGFAVNSPLQLSPSVLLRFAQLITPFSLLASLNFFFFLKLFVNERINTSSGLLALPTLVICLFSFSSTNVYLDAQSQLALGGLYPFYIGVLLFNVLLIFNSLFNREAHRVRGNSQKYLQLSYLKVGAFIAVIPTVAFGAILPLFSDSALSNISPLFAIAFLAFAGIAIVRHHLFDLRLAVARSFAYVLTLSSIVLIVIVAGFIATDTLFSGSVNSGVEWFYATLAVVLSLLFPYFKRFFDNITRQLFYRDAYDSQEVLDKISGIAVAEIDLKRILDSTRMVLSEALKSSFVEFVLLRDDELRLESSGATSRLREVKSVTKCVSSQHQDLLVTDELTTSSGVREVFGENGVALSLRLKTHQQLVGYALLGEKRSGTIYSDQDRRLLLIVANELAISTQNALRFEEIEHFNVTLQQRINDATRQLRRANVRLKTLDETKDDFISMASHQLRTPLTSVKGYISMVLEGDAGKLTPKEKQMLNQAYTSSQRMVYLIADLLNVSRLKTGKFIITPVRANLADIVEDEVRQLVETAKSHSLELIYNKPKNFPELMLDETKTRQVIMNFMDNAIYYTPKGGKVEVQLTDKSAAVELRVKDNGIGVPKSEAHHLFTKFYRAGNARKARPDGTGLGLFMAKKVVVAQGGAIIFETKEGQGSTFGFTFSKSKLAVSAGKEPGLAKIGK